MQQEIQKNSNHNHEMNNLHKEIPSHHTHNVAIQINGQALIPNFKYANNNEEDEEKVKFSLFSSLKIM